MRSALAMITARPNRKRFPVRFQTIAESPCQFSGTLIQNVSAVSEPLSSFHRRWTVGLVALLALFAAQCPQDGDLFLRRIIFRQVTNSQHHGTGNFPSPFVRL